MDLAARIAQDTRDYELLCEQYGEPVQRRGWWPDCYGEHSRKLRARELADAMKEVRDHG